MNTKFSSKLVKVSTEIDHEQIFTSGMIHRSCGEAARPMDHGTGTSTTSMYLSNMVPTQTPAKTIQTSVLRRTGTGARDSGSIKYIAIAPPNRAGLPPSVRGPCLIERRISGYFQRSEVKTAVVRSQVRGRGRYSRSCLPSTSTRRCASRWRGQMWPWGGVGGPQNEKVRGRFK